MRTLKSIWFLTILSVCVDMHAQNFVLNPSFEELLKCPNDYSQLDFAKHWKSVGATPDLLNICDFYEMVYNPEVAPYNGNSIAAINISFPFFMADDTIFREFMQGSLSESLSNEPYFLSMQILADHRNRANHLGVLFSNGDIKNIDYPKKYFPQLEFSDEWIGDYGKWKQHCGCIEGLKNAKYFTIGNFTPPLTDSIEFSNVYFGSRIHIDQVELRRPKPIFITDTIYLGECIDLPIFFDSIPYFYQLDGKVISTFCGLNTGSFEIMQTPKNCTKSFKLNVVVIDNNCKIYIPNVFSPNDDGKEDVFQLFFDEKSDVDMTEFKIFDRWGGLVFDQNIYKSIFWNGIKGDQYLADGVYVYLIKYTCSVDGKKRVFTQSGDITLIR